MATLEDKLRKIVEKYENTDSDVLVAQIIQAFKDEGYYYESPEIKQKVMDHALYGTMTGQEWVSRFNDELKHLVPRGDGETWMGWGCNEVREAAKKASGLQ